APFMAAIVKRSPCSSKIDTTRFVQPAPCPTASTSSAKSSALSRRSISSSVAPLPCTTAAAAATAASRSARLFRPQPFRPTRLLDAIGMVQIPERVGMPERQPVDNALRHVEMACGKELLPGTALLRGGPQVGDEQPRTGGRRLPLQLLDDALLNLLILHRIVS